MRLEEKELQFEPSSSIALAALCNAPVAGRALGLVSTTGVNDEPVMRDRILNAISKWAGWLLAGSAALLAWGFEEISDEVFSPPAISNGSPRIDRAIFFYLVGLRSPWLTALAVDLTALGSPAVLGIFTAIVVSLLMLGGDKRGAVHMLAASTGAAALTAALKATLARPRPLLAPRLVEVAGFSYPSGHSLGAAAVLTTAAIIATQRMASSRMRVATFAYAWSLVVLIAGSRIYLGVHYPTDSAAGILVGLAWAALVAAAFRWLAPNRLLVRRVGSSNHVAQ